MGRAGFVLIAVAALLSTTSAINATLYGAARLSFTVARDGEVPAVLDHRVGRNIVRYGNRRLPPRVRPSACRRSIVCPESLHRSHVHRFAHSPRHGGEISSGAGGQTPGRAYANMMIESCPPILVDFRHGIHDGCSLRASDSWWQRLTGTPVELESAESGSANNNHECPTSLACFLDGEP